MVTSAAPCAQGIDLCSSGSDLRYQGLFRTPILPVAVANCAHWCLYGDGVVSGRVGRRGGSAAAGLSWPLPEEIDHRRLEELLFPAAVGRPSQSIRALPDFAEVRRQLQVHKHLTLQLVWEEYRETQPDAYGYSRYVAAAFMLRNRLKAMTDARTGNFHAT